MKIRTLPEADQELLAAAVWYDDQDSGVGVRFLNAYEVALDLIRNRCRSSLESSPSHTVQDIQRVRLRRFPYTIIYERFASEVVILAGHIPVDTPTTGSDADSTETLISGISGLLVNVGRVDCR